MPWSPFSRDVQALQKILLDMGLRSKAYQQLSASVRSPIPVLSGAPQRPEDEETRLLRGKGSPTLKLFVALRRLRAAGLMDTARSGNVSLSGVTPPPKPKVRRPGADARGETPPAS